MIHDYENGVTLFGGRHLDLQAEANSSLFFINEVCGLHTETLMSLIVGTAQSLSQRVAALEFKYNKSDGSELARLRGLKSDAQVVTHTRQVLKEAVSSLLAIEHEICVRASNYISSYEELRMQLGEFHDDSSASGSEAESLASEPNVSPVPVRKFRRA